MHRVNPTPGPVLVDRFYEQSNVLPQDIISQIFAALMRMSDIPSLGRFAQVNNYYSRVIGQCFDTIDLKLCLPPRLYIVDASLLATQGIIVKDEPLIDNRAVLKDWKALTSYTENRLGTVYLTIGKGFSLNSTIALAAGEEGKEAEKKMIVTCQSDQFLKENEAVCAEKTYRVMITQSILQGSENKDPLVQQALAISLKCRISTALEQTFLCVVMWKLFQVCLFGDNPRKEALTSTTFESLGGGSDYPLSVGATSPAYRNDFFGDGSWKPARLFVLSGVQNFIWRGVAGCRDTAVKSV